ncbi:hypothetical protein HDU67_006076, partial [Dinochytrium kinnereticum]
MHIPSTPRTPTAVARALQIGNYHLGSATTAVAAEPMLALGKRRWSDPSDLMDVMDQEGCSKALERLQRRAADEDRLSDDSRMMAFRRDAIQDLLQPSNLDVVGIEDFILPTGLPSSSSSTITTLESRKSETRDRRHLHHRHDRDGKRRMRRSVSVAGDLGMRRGSMLSRAEEAVYGFSLDSAAGPSNSTHPAGLTPKLTANTVVHDGDEASRRKDYEEGRDS